MCNIYIDVELSLYVNVRCYCCWRWQLTVVVVFSRSGYLYFDRIENYLKFIHVRTVKINIMRYLHFRMHFRRFCLYACLSFQQQKQNSFLTVFNLFY